MDNEGKYWATFWAIVGIVTSIFLICLCIHGYEAHNERMAMIAKGIAPPVDMTESQYLLAKSRIEHGCLAPEQKAVEGSQ